MSLHASYGPNQSCLHRRALHFIVFFFFKAHVYSREYHIQRTQYEQKTEKHTQGNRARADESNITGGDDEDHRPPSHHSPRVPPTLKKAAEPTRRAVTEIQPMNEHGQHPPAPAPPPCRSRLRSRRRQKPPTSPGPEFQPPDPPPPRIRRKADELERRTGPRAPASQARGRRAPRSSAAGESCADTKPPARSTISSRAPPARTPPYPTVYTSRSRGSPTLPPPKRPAEERNPAARGAHGGSTDSPQKSPNPPATEAAYFPFLVRVTATLRLNLVAAHVFPCARQH